MSNGVPAVAVIRLAIKNVRYNIFIFNLKKSEIFLIKDISEHIQ